MASITRRNAVAVAAMTGACASALPTAALATSDAVPAYPFEQEVDVIVVGSGTGLMAALKAAESGARVLIIEKDSVPGGDTAISGGVIYVGGNTFVQEAMGVKDERTGEPDTMEQFMADWYRHAGEGTGINKALMDKVLQSGPELLEWFDEMDVPLTVYKSGIDPVQRGHKPLADPSEGSMVAHYLTDAIISELEANDVEIILNTAAKEILTDPITDEIIGVKCKTSDGAVKFYGCKALILACSGAGSNKDLTMTYNPEAINWVNVGKPTSQGEGFVMASKLGAAIVGQGNWLDPANPNPLIVGVYAGTRIQEPLIINRVAYALSGPRPLIFTDYAGNRFCDETKGYPNQIGLDLALLEGAFCWSIQSAEYWDLEFINNYLRGCGSSPQQMQEEKIVMCAADIAELSEITGIDVDVLQATIDDWNAKVAAGVDDAFGRPVESMQELTAPYTCYRIIPAAPTPQVGASISLNIDEFCRVLDVNEIAIPGLYAVGTGMTMAPTMGRGYPGSGSNLTAGFGCALIAGPEAARFAAEK